MFISVHECLTANEIDNNNSNCEVIWAEDQTQGKPITIGAFADHLLPKKVLCSMQVGKTTY